MNEWLKSFLAFLQVAAVVFRKSCVQLFEERVPMAQLFKSPIKVSAPRLGLIRHQLAVLLSKLHFPQIWLAL